MTRAALRVLFLLAIAELLPACVIGRSARPTATESAQGPLAPPVTGSPVVPATLAENSDAPPNGASNAKPGALWIQGYWHWDGVKYVWQRGRWQSGSGK